MQVSYFLAEITVFSSGLVMVVYMTRAECLDQRFNNVFSSDVKIKSFRHPFLHIMNE